MIKQLIAAGMIGMAIGIGLTSLVQWLINRDAYQHKPKIDTKPRQP